MNRFQTEAEYIIRQGFKILVCNCRVLGEETTLDCLRDKYRTNLLPLIEYYPVLHNGKLIEITDILLRPKQSKIMTLDELRTKMPNNADRLVVEISKRF